MGLLQDLRSLYSLDTLDTRFTSSSSSPPVAIGAAAIQGDVPATRQENGLNNGRKDGNVQTRPRLWETNEFYFYVAYVTAAVILMFKTVYDISQPTDPNYKNYEHLLSDGWMFGRKADNSDGQYAGFRDNLPFTFALVVLHPTLRHLFNKMVPASAIPVAGFSTKAIEGKSRFEQRVVFDRYFALAFITALHGISAIKILLILYVNFSIAHRLPRQQVPVVTWIFNVVILFANELCRGYPFASIAEMILPAGMGQGEKTWGTYLDGFGGLIPRWEVFFKFTILRMISYNMDFHWSTQRGSSDSIEKKQLDPAKLSERDRVSMSAEPQNYNFRTYLSYCLYSPLFLAGPILTFNDYVSQSHYPLAHLTWPRVIKYGIRFLVALLTMEFSIHFLYAVAICKATPDWSIYSPGQISLLGYWNLHHIWLKLLLPWRFFRLWSLADGLDPPENMVRCMSDNYSTGAFWRGWHRSFNRWIVRYIFIPLGGSGSRTSKKGWLGRVRSGVNLLAVFTFVAVWHDINLRLLIWGWMVVFFVAPEVLATMVFPKRKWENRWTAYRMLCGLGAVFNIFMMMVANLVGFAVGVDGLQKMLEGVLGSYQGIASLLVACSAFFIGSQVMFEHREEEMRQGIVMRC